MTGRGVAHRGTAVAVALVAWVAGPTVAAVAAAPVDVGLPPTIAAPPVNDDFAAATVLDGNAGGLTNEKNLGASVEGTLGEEACPFTPSHSVWYRWTPSETGAARVTVNAARTTAPVAFDPTLEVCVGSSPSKLTPVASSNDANGSLEPEVDFTATAGVTYRIRVDSAGTVTGSFAISYGVDPPANDDFADAVPLGDAAGSTAGDLARSTGEAGEPGIGTGTTSSVWFSWTVPESGPARLTTAGSATRNQLTVWTGSTLTALTLVASNDVGAHGTLVDLTAAAGTRYQIQVRGSGAFRGSFQLDYAVNPPDNDLFAGSATVAPLESSFAQGSSSRAVGQPDEPTAAQATSASEWFSWTAPGSGMARVSLAESGYDTRLAVFVGSGLSDLSQVAVNDDANDTRQSMLDFEAVEGTRYWLLVDAGDLAQTDPAQGRGLVRINLGLDPPTNDLFADAEEVGGATGSVDGSNRHAVFEPGEPRGTAGGGDQSVWYRWTAPASGKVSFTALAPSLDLTIAAYTGSQITDLTEIAADDDAGPRFDPVGSFFATAGQRYVIAVSGGFGGGAFTLRWSYATCQVLPPGGAGPATDPGGELEVATIVGTDVIEGTGGDDVIVGSAGPDQIDGLGGADTVCSGGGDDFVFGGDDADKLVGGPGDDRLVGGAADDLLEGQIGNDALRDDTGADLVLGGAGSDTLTVPGSADADHFDTFDGGPGIDTIFYSTRQVSVSVSLGDTLANDGAANEGDLVLATERVEGGGGDDSLTGNLAANVLIGNAGNDLLKGSAGDDRTFGGPGDDRLVAGAGADLATGQGGADDIVVQDGVGGNDTADGGAGIDTVHADPGDTLLNFP